MTAPDDQAETEQRHIGDLIDALGIRATLGANELVEGAIIILKVIDSDGDSRLTIANSDQLGWIERCGMLRVAERVESDMSSND